MKYNPHNYQLHAEQHIYDYPGCGLFIDMGLGKTVVTLTAMYRLLYEEFEISKVLVIAPKRVAEHTWTAEIAKWDHLQDLTVSKVLGSEKERKAALAKKADVYLINRENVAWIVAQYGGKWPFDMVVIDELSSFKSAKSGRFKALRQVRPLIKRMVGLTGTPAPNSLLDLWSQLYLLDRGERLGKTYTEYRDTYFRVKNPHQSFAKYQLIEEKDELVGKGYYAKKIYNKISDICISMKAADYLELPERIINDIPVTMNSFVKARYEAFEKEQVLALMEQDVEITAVNAGALCTKLLQFSNGAIYDEDKQYHVVHDEKIDELSELIDDAAGQPVLIFYTYQHDADRIMKHFKGRNIVRLKSDKDINAWNRGEIEIMLAHPASAGHGLNLQEGGSIVIFFGLPWSLELYLQAIARLHRQGQVKNVIVHRLITRGTVDEEVVASLERKEEGQDALMSAVKVVKMLIKKHRAA